MKYLALDVETTGRLIKRPDRLLQLSGVVEDSTKPIPLLELPHFTCLIAQEEYVGEAGALKMHSWIFEELDRWERTRFRVKQVETKYPVFFQRDFIRPFREFLDKHFGEHAPITVMGMNAGGFDMQFLPPDIQDWFRSGVLDPGSLFVDFTKDRLPYFKEVCTALVVEPDIPHDAYLDNLKGIECVRKAYPSLP